LNVREPIQPILLIQIIDKPPQKTKDWKGKICIDRFEVKLWIDSKRWTKIECPKK